jgi:UDP-N-acetylglucosamine--N-acetylmuramyl-(pentapeptide) pyrophosphoryl-undecaprenol N-acetylglucosamine transferase
MPRTIMIMAGGTGGHVFPGLAVADCLRDKGWKIVWLGNRAGMEAALVAGRGYEMAWVNFAGLRGKGLAAQAMLPLRLLRASWQSARAMFTYRPDVVLGLGGYQSFPGGMVAALLRRPVVIHEQNRIAGLANKVLARVADRVLSGFPGALPKAIAVGNPVRREIAALPSPESRYAGRSGALRLLVMGGSLGARALNETVPAALAQLPVDRRPIVLHQAGRQHVEELAGAYRRSGVSAQVLAFIDDVAAAYRDADLAICRAGALTVAELAAAGIASVLVPYPHAVDDHQTANARYLADSGAAILLPQEALSAERIAALLAGLTRERLCTMAVAARSLARPDATEHVAGVCMELAT